MSILIKGMEKPETCSKCPFCQFDGLDLKLRCLVTDEDIFFDAKKKRAGNCPLVEIPPHGRLIDADKLEYNSIGCWARDEVRPPQDDTEWLISKYDIDEETPTVIESEEQENE